MAIYKIRFDAYAKDMRLKNLCLLEAIDFYFLEEDGSVLIQCQTDRIDAVEYELRRAERNDFYCDWKRIK